MRTTTRRNLATGLGAIALVGSLAACGSDDEVVPTSSGTTTSSSASSSDGASGSGDASAGDRTSGSSAGDGTSSSSDASSSSDGSSTSTSTGEHADGTYSATGSYLSPAGEETVAVSVTLEDDTITAVTVTPQADDPTASQYQQKFASGIAAVVVGKDIDDVSVSTVSGSSLTGAGFNTALADISSQSAV